METIRRNLGLIVAAAGFALFSLVMPPQVGRPRYSPSVEMEVALPRFVQVIMAAGDRFLAANLASFRTLVAATENMKPENYRVQARVQLDAAWFNPAHEDNYYLAANLLPWNGQLEAGQAVLRAAIDARPFDWQPAFFYGFDILHFEKRPAEGARWLQLAALRTTDEMQSLALQQMAARWSARGDDLDLAIRLHREMARGSRHKGFAAFLEKRAKRLENLLAIDRALAAYAERFGTAAIRLDQLVGARVIAEIPVDPFGARYEIGSDGRASAKDVSRAGGH